MASDNTKEDKIVMPNGDMVTRSNIVKSSISYYKQAYGSNLTDVCDFSEGSEIRTLHESWAVELFAKYKHSEEKAKMKYVKYATGNYLDSLAAEFHLERKQGEVAKGSVVFSTSANVNGSMTVPKGTIILARNTGYEYKLQQNIYITSPNTPVTGEVHSRLKGAKYNALEDTLTAFQSIETIRAEIKVTNPTPIVDGRDEETDEELRERILKAKQERAYGTVSSYSNLLLEEVSDLHDVQFVDSEVLASSSSYPRHYKAGTTSTQIANKTFAEIKPYLCTECTAVLFVNAMSKPAPSHVVDDVDYIMTQQNNLIVGQKFHVEKAVLVKVYLHMQLYVTSIINEDDVREQLECFFDGGAIETKNGAKTYRGLNIGEALEKSQLLDVLEEIPGVHQVGYLKICKYYPKIPTDINQWNNNGSGGYTYVDDDKYVYYRRNSDASSINHWGTKNWSSLTLSKGKVFSLGQRKDVDSSTNKIFYMSQELVNEQGELID